MTNFTARARVLLHALPTYLVALGAILAIIVDELAPFADLVVVEWVVRVAGVAITVIGVAVVIVRRVTPVVESERGLLPPPAPVDRVG